MRARRLLSVAGAALLVLSACAEDVKEPVASSAAAGAGAVARPPTPTKTPTSAALKSYCRHAIDTQAVVTGINEGEIEDGEAYQRGLAVETLLWADADGLRREKKDAQAKKVADHATALRAFVDGYIGRGPYAGTDILAVYYRASDQGRRLCTGYKAQPTTRNKNYLGGQ